MCNSNLNFKTRHEYMQEEAHEHYDLLVNIQIGNPVYNKMLLENYHRKEKVKSLLNASANWNSFTKQISPSKNCVTKLLGQKENQ